MKKHMMIIIAAGVLTVGSVAFASDSNTPTVESEDHVTMKQAKEIALEKVDGTITSAEKDEDNGKTYYEIDIDDGTTEYEFEIDARTGEIVEFDKDVQKKHHTQKAGEVITKDEALAIAQEKAPNASVKEIELETDDGWKIYDIELIDGNIDYEIDVDAVTGEIIEFEKDEKQSPKAKQANKEVIELTPENKIDEKAPRSTTTLTMDEAVAIAKEHATGSVTEVERDDDVFEIEMEDGDIEYEIEIDVMTGEIVSFEKDLD